MLGFPFADREQWGKMHLYVMGVETGVPEGAESFRSWERVCRLDPPTVLSQTLKQVGPAEPGTKENKT